MACDSLIADHIQGQARPWIQARFAASQIKSGKKIGVFCNSIAFDA